MMPQRATSQDTTMRLSIDPKSVKIKPFVWLLGMFLLLSGSFAQAQQDSKRFNINFSDHAIYYEGVLDLDTNILTAKLFDRESGELLARREISLQTDARRNLVIMSGEAEVPYDSGLARAHAHPIRLFLSAANNTVTLQNCPTDKCFNGAVTGRATASQNAAVPNRRTAPAPSPQPAQRQTAPRVPNYLRNAAYRMTWELDDIAYEALVLLQDDGNGFVRVRYISPSTRSIQNVQMSVTYKRIDLEDENIPYADVLVGDSPIDVATKQTSLYIPDNFFFFPDGDGGFIIYNMDRLKRKMRVSAESLGQEELQRLWKRFER